MSSARLSTKGQLVIPARFRKALNLRPGDEIELALAHRGLVLKPKSKRAKVKRGKFGRPVLVAASGAPPITTGSVLALLEDLP